MKYILIPLVLTFLFVVSCSDDDIPVQGIEMELETLTMAVGNVELINVTFLPDGAEGTLTWSSSNIEIASVNSGEVTAFKLGSVYVYAYHGEFADSCLVTVDTY
ncbi:Ig-like domain-containing protein [Carboxylicivirga sp. M1479]|uniref:Ig-like domain-containing protein n=1 Tax=Carboxylicivirga sp. M1479 TaxID=2594476 RepID=UPI001178800D|nr:Ig-like domain-containing protein [Carboxylicivirga sp. M1479]TRX63983.1 hypothetical protein FNN09_18235 [Carboxylicivirga sp. M1479]